MNIKITTHAKQRIYERKKLRKQPLQEDVKKAWYRGISDLPEEFDNYDKEVRIYDNFVYLFDVEGTEATLVTVLYLPKNLRGIQGKKRKASKNYINRKL